MIKKAEGRAQSILKVKKAEALGIKLIREAEAEGLKILNAAKVTNEVLTLKSYEAVKDLANGQATKIIVPSELQNLATAATTIKEVIHTGKK
jgi:regulator of protease activity HflC (stomatin/prohibitin superfamily)